MKALASSAEEEKFGSIKREEETEVSIHPNDEIQSGTIEKLISTVKYDLHPVTSIEKETQIGKPNAGED